jgi:aminopeptidase YwaD
MHRHYLRLFSLIAALAFSCSPTAAAPAPTPLQAAPTPTEAVAVAPTPAGAPTAASAPAPPPAPSAPTAVVARAEPPAAESAARPTRFSGLEAKLHVDALAVDIGSRPAGSESQARAAQYVLEQLSALGYQTELQPFPITYYDERGASFTVGGALGRSIPINILTYSASGEVEGELVDVGLARPGDFSPAAVGGKIALIRRGEIRFSEKVENVAQAGATAAVIYNNEPNNFNGNAGTATSIPAVSVSQDDGESLLAQLRRGPVTARVAVDVRLEQRTAANVVATKPGGPQTIVIGGHLDSVSAGPGANDNASGTAVMLEVARILAARPTPFTVKFVAFDAEEIGLLGSGHLVQQLSPAERESIRAMLNLDMVGVGDRVLLGGSDDLTRLATGVATGLGQPARPIDSGLNGASDHASFMRAGIPALFVYRSNDPNYHSPNDRAEFVDPANLQFAGDLVLGVLDVLEGGP